jgi:hypothetical protein
MSDREAREVDMVDLDELVGENPSTRCFLLVPQQEDALGLVMIHEDFLNRFCRGDRVAVGWHDDYLCPDWGWTGRGSDRVSVGERAGLARLLSPTEKCIFDPGSAYVPRMPRGWRGLRVWDVEMVEQQLDQACEYKRHVEVLVKKF